MAHGYIKEDETFNTSRNGTVPKPTQAEVTAGKVLKADGTWGEGGGGGGSSTLAGLTDVDLTNPSDGQILKYDAQSQKWENANESGGHTYSTTEQVVAIWTDGKPVYEITVTFASKSIVGNSWNDVDTFLNIDTLIAGWGRYNASNVTDVFLGIFRYDKSNNKLKMWFPTNYAITGYIIRYTKTTG